MILTTIGHLLERKSQVVKNYPVQNFFSNLFGNIPYCNYGPISYVPIPDLSELGAKELLLT